MYKKLKKLIVNLEQTLLRNAALEFSKKKKKYFKFCRMLYATYMTKYILIVQTTILKFNNN
jgi:hypothetical protein